MTVMSGIEARFCRSAPWRGFARQLVLPWVLRDVELSGRGLEIGGGSGAMAYELLRRQSDIQLTMADLDPTMVDVARDRLAPFGRRAEVKVGDATALTFESNSFDFACSWLMLHHTIEWRDVISEMARVVRPGGVIAGYDLADTGMARLVHRVDGSEHRLIRPSDLRGQLDQLGLESARVTTALGGLVMRFAATSSNPP